MNRGTTMLTNVLSRMRHPLIGDWNVIVDPYEMGYWGILGDRSPRGFFRDFTPRHPGDRVEYDFDASPTLTVPGDWNTQDERLFYYEGTVWYRRTARIRPERRGERTFLYVGAANHTSRVFFDGEELATHAGGFGPFAVELTGRVNSPARAEHSIVIQVDNRREPDRIPAMRSDWWNFGGLTREVAVLNVPETYLADAWLTMAPDGRVIGGHRVVGGDEPVRITIPELDVDTVVEAEYELDVDPERWHPGRPNRYEVHWTCGDDAVRDHVGFRTVTTDGNDIVVNGERTFLRGISIHGEGPSGGRRAHGIDDARTLLGWADDLGANFVRLAHYQHDERMVREADRRGLLAWCELPVYWGIAFDQPHVLENAIEQLDELVIRDRSRASIVFWSVANETMPSPERTAFLTTLAERARRLDPTRLVSAALLTLPSDELEHVIDDPLGEVVDVVAVNQYLGWYYGERERIPDATWRSTHDKPIVFTETGAGAKAGHHGDEGQIWTEEFQAAVYEAQIEMVRRQRTQPEGGGAVAGLSPWILKDFRAPVRVLPGIQDGFNRKGLVDEEGRRKLAFDVLRDFYRELADEG